MGIKYIPVPDPILLIDPDTGIAGKAANGEPLLVSFKTFTYSLKGDPRLVVDFESIERAVTIFAAIRELEQSRSNVLQLADEDYKLLKLIAEKPQYTIKTQMGSQIVQGYPMWTADAMMQLYPFVKSIVNASDKPFLVEVKDDRENV